MKKWLQCSVDNRESDEADQIEWQNGKMKVIMSTQETLSWIRHGKVRLCWVPGNSNVEGNMKTDKLTKLVEKKARKEQIESPLPSINSQKDAVEEII